MNHLVDYAKSFLGTHYVYGGNTKLSGLDCSGLVCEILRSAGVIGSEDLSAQLIYNRLCINATKSEKVGSIAFYGKSHSQITHVAFHIDRYRVIEAGGGDSTVTDFKTALQAGACVRMRPYQYRKDYIISLYPNYATIGLT